MGDTPHTGAPHRATRRSPKGEARREAILTSAAHLFATGGLDSVSLTDIATDVGITKAGVLHHFPSKNALLLAVLERRDQVNDSAFPARGIDALIGFLDLLHANEADPSDMQFFAMMSAQSIAVDHPAHDHFVRRQAMFARVMASVLADVFDEERLPDGVGPADVAWWMLALAEGLRNEWLRDRTSVDRTAAMLKLLNSLSYAMHDEARTALQEYGARTPMRRSAITSEKDGHAV